MEENQMLIKIDGCYIKINEVYERFATTTPYTPWYSMPNYDWVKYRRVGDFVEIRVMYESSTAFKMPDWTNLVVGVLPVGFRPYRYYEGRVLTCTSNTYSAPYTKFDVSSDGSILLFHWMSSHSYTRIQGHIVYRVKDTQTE